jgi:VanZ family protein
MDGHAFPARFSPARFLLAIGASTALVLSAPFIGQIRSAILRAFPGQFVAIMGIAVGVATCAALGAAVIRIRDRRLLRYGLIVLALVTAVTYSIRSQLGNPVSDAVERFHFVEYGVITFLFYRAWRPLDDGGVLTLPILAGLIVGTLEEWFQWFIPARIGEVRDVLLNGAAIVSGLLFSLAIDPPARWNLRVGRRSSIQIANLAIAGTVVFACFLNSVHLGYEIGDPEIGVFRSIYSTADLESLSRDRAGRWTSAPPPIRPPRLSREDQYLSEGLLHVQARNLAWEHDIATAWFENRILEKYFAPVLAIGHRWPPEQRADGERRFLALPAATRSFVSHAQGEFPIFTWSKSAFWAVVAAIVLAIALGRALVVRSVARTSAPSPT